MLKHSPTPSSGSTTRTRRSSSTPRSSGWRCASDVTVPEMGNFRWLTVGPPGQDDVAIVLMAIPGPPVIDAETADAARRR